MSNVTEINEKILSNEELLASLRVDGFYIYRDDYEKIMNGDKESLFKIGQMYNQRKEYSKSHPWLFKAAAQNSSNAQCHLGFMYNLGIGVTEDYKQAMKWYLESVYNDGNPNALTSIGDLYRFGHGVPKSIPSAIEWFTKAVIQGDKVAQGCFGMICEEEEGYIDLQKAVNWYKISADNGFEEAKTRLKRLNELGCYPSDDYKHVEIPKLISISHPSTTRERTTNNSNNENEEDTILQMKEEMKKLEETVQLSLTLIQQDQKEKNILQKRLDIVEYEQAKMKVKLKKKDKEISHLQELLKQCKIGLEDKAEKDVCGESPNRKNENKSGSTADAEDDDSRNDLNYDSSENED